MMFAERCLRRADSRAAVPGFMNTLSAILMMALMHPGAPPATAHAPTGPSDPIAAAVLDLGDPDVRVRERATRFLWEAGEAALAALTAAVDAGDPETATRARGIIADIRCGISPATPPEVVEAVRLYRSGTEDDKRQAISVLKETDSPAALGALARLLRLERDLHLRRMLFGALSARGCAAASALIADGDFDHAEQLLRRASGDGDRESRAYAAFLVLYGGDRHTTSRLESEMAAGSEGAARMLFWLYRAKGDIEAATRCARACRDPELLDGLLLETGRYASLAELRAGDMQCTDIERLGFLAACQRLAGRTDAMQQTLARIRTLARNRPDMAFIAAEAHLLNEQIDSGIDLLVAAGQFQAALELLSARGQYDRALKLAETSLAAGNENTLEARSALAVHLRMLGETARAGEILDVLSSQAARSSADHRALLIRTWIRCGMRGPALQACAAALKHVGNADETSVLVNALFPSGNGDAGAWYMLLRAAHPDSTPAPLLERAGRLAGGVTTPGELGYAIDEAFGAGGLAEPARRLALYDMAESIERAGHLPAALRVWKRLAEEYAEARPCVRAASLHIRNGQWQAAADMCLRAIARDSSSAAARFLRARALEHMGKAAEAEALVRMATMLPLADDDRHNELMQELFDAGLADDALAQAELAKRLGEPLGVFSHRAMRYKARHLTETGRHFDAAALHERSMLACLRGGIAYTDVAAYLHVPRMIRVLRARGHLQAGRIDSALAEIDAAMAIAPGDTDVAIEFAPALVRAGRQEDARRLIERVLSHYRRLLEAWPRSAALHNAAAWLLVRCRTRLDEALAHARRGVELDPDNCAIIDTLAEVHFQRGNRSEAIATIRRCIELEPWHRRHRDALMRFESQSPDTPPPPE